MMNSVPTDSTHGKTKSERQPGAKSLLVIQLIRWISLTLILSSCFSKELKSPLFKFLMFKQLKEAFFQQRSTKISKTFGRLTVARTDDRNFEDFFVCLLNVGTNGRHGFPIIYFNQPNLVPRNRF